METVKLTIDNIAVEVPKGTTILRAARQAGIEVPTLCHMHLHEFNINNRPGSCRVCVVEVKGRRNLAPACCTDCMDGMEVYTRSMRVLNARKIVVELILSDHPKDCLTCAKSGHCELQNLSINLGIRAAVGDQNSAVSVHRLDTSSYSIARDMNKCIMCRRCETMCNEVQTVGALSAINRGFAAVVAPAFDQDLTQSPCTFCGQCAAVCPVGALTEIDNTEEVQKALLDPTKTVVVQTAPAVRAALGEEFGLAPGTSVTGKMAAALRRLGFARVLDTDFAADVTIMEEGSELLDRLTRYLQGDKKVTLPILTSCCPAWVNFYETFFPDMLDYPSTARSPQQMFGAIAKTFLANKMGLRREDMVVVSVMPCIAKKSECKRPELGENGDPDVDIVLSTRELARLIKQNNINFLSLPDEDFDHPLGDSTGAAVIFGVTGGVMEAAVRTAYELHTGKPLPKIEFHELRGFEGIREATLDFDGLPLRVAIAHTLGNARKLMEGIRSGKLQYHAVEVMACPGGCIGGGGQPLHHGDSSIVRARMKAIYDEDRQMTLRKSHLNPEVIALYEAFFKKPMSEKAHHLLHTHYTPHPNF